MRLKSFLFLAIVSGLACKKADPPRSPLGASHPSPATSITGPAKAALDSGNTLFRAKDYDRALDQYVSSARLAPSEAAPLLGILMVADVKGDQKLTEATLARLRKIDPSLADTSAVTPHSKMIQAHPQVPPAKGG
jgi:hypothetical protein